MQRSRPLEYLNSICLLMPSLPATALRQAYADYSKMQRSRPLEYLNDICVSSRQWSFSSLVQPSAVSFSCCLTPSSRGL